MRNLYLLHILLFYVRFQKRGLLVLFLSAVSALLELISIIIASFALSYLLNGEEMIARFDDYTILNQVSTLVSTNFSTYSACLVAILIILLSSAFTTFYTFMSTQYAQEIARKISTKGLRHYLQSNQIIKSESDLISQYSEQMVRVVHQVLIPAGDIVGRGISVFFISSMLLLIAFQESFLLIGTLGIVFVCLFAVTRRIMHQNGTVLNSTMEGRMAFLKEAIEGKKELFSYDAADIMLDGFHSNLEKFGYAETKNRIFSILPKFTIETIVLVIIIVTAFLSFSQTTELVSVEVISFLGVGALRILPGLQQVFFRVSQINGAKPAYANLQKLNSSKANIDIPEGSRSILINKNKIKCVKINIKTDSGVSLLKDAKLSLHKGAIVSITGPSGVGKSSLLECLIGLGSGSYQCIDMTNSELSGNIAYMPQKPCIFQGSLWDNITLFGTFSLTAEEFNEIIEACGLEQLHDLHKHSGNQISQGGKNLSGGQQQRIGFARALVSDKPVLFMDECTSALDLATERKMLDYLAENIEERFVFLVAHRSSVLERSDTIYEINNTKILRK